VLDGVRMVWASLLEKPLKVVYGQLRLTHHTRVARFLTAATAVVGHGCDILKTLLAPLLASLVVHLSILNDGARRRFSAATWGQAKFGTSLLVTLHSSSVAFLNMSINAWKGSVNNTSCMPLLDASTPGPLGSWLCLPQPLGSLRCEFYARHSCSARGPCHHSEAWGEKSVSGGGAALVVEGSTVGPCQPAPM
jgi:hypothetical protein